MDMKTDLSPLFRDMLNHEEGDAAEDLRLALNSIIGKYNLHASRVISLLARLSAGYIYLTQKLYDDAGADEVVEEDFQNMLTAHLTDLDMSDVDKELEKMKREELN